MHLSDPIHPDPMSWFISPLLVMYLVVEILIDICFLRLSYPFVSDRQPLVVVRYRYAFHFIPPVVYNACTLDYWIPVRISTWASTLPILPCLSLVPCEALSSRFDNSAPIAILSGFHPAPGVRPALTAGGRVDGPRHQ